MTTRRPSVVFFSYILIKQFLTFSLAKNNREKLGVKAGLGRIVTPAGGGHFAMIASDQKIPDDTILKR